MAASWAKSSGARQDAPSVAAGLVIGANGLIGGELLRRLGNCGWTALGTTHRPSHDRAYLHFDLAESASGLLSADAVRVLRASGDWVVFLTAGVNGYRRCAQEPLSTRRVNVTNSSAVAEDVMRAGGFLVYPSSAAVFGDSTDQCGESASPSPNSEYGRQKADAERILLSLISRARVPGGGLAVVRLTKVVAATDFIAKWMQALRTGHVIEAATNRSLSPISLPFAARGLVCIAEARKSGLYHLGGETALSYFELALHLARALGAREDQVRPVTVAAESVVPVNSACLDMSETTRRVALLPQSLESAICDLVSSAADDCADD